VDLALKWFPRIVGMRSGRVVFDLPAGSVTPEMLSALYASEGGVPPVHGVDPHAHDSATADVVASQVLQPARL
jgi:phosphonate transport system ATP-binding protein